MYYLHNYHHQSLISPQLDRGPPPMSAIAPSLLPFVIPLGVQDYVFCRVTVSTIEYVYPVYRLFASHAWATATSACWFFDSRQYYYRSSNNSDSLSNSFRWKTKSVSLSTGHVDAWFWINEAIDLDFGFNQIHTKIKA